MCHVSEEEGSRPREKLPLVEHLARRHLWRAMPHVLPPPLDEEAGHTRHVLV